MKRITPTSENLKKLKKGDILQYSWGTQYEIIHIVDSDKNGIRLQLKCIVSMSDENLGDIISVYISFTRNSITKILLNNFNEKLDKILAI